jgi:hypothetical protein
MHLPLFSRVLHLTRLRGDGEASETEERVTERVLRIAP